MQIIIFKNVEFFKWNLWILVSVFRDFQVSIGSGNAITQSSDDYFSLLWPSDTTVMETNAGPLANASAF